MGGVATCLSSGGGFWRDAGVGGARETDGKERSRPSVACSTECQRGGELDGVQTRAWEGLSVRVRVCRARPHHCTRSERDKEGARCHGVAVPKRRA